MAGRLVGQTGFFPGDRRLRKLDLLGGGLPLLHRLIPWERFLAQAAVHDSPCLEALLDPENQGVQVFAEAPIVQQKRSKCSVKKVTAAESMRRRSATAP